MHNASVAESEGLIFIANPAIIIEMAKRAESKLIGLRIVKPLLTRLDSFAMAAHRTRTEIVLRAIEEYLDKRAPLAAQQDNSHRKIGKS